jgi:hypothetical protein
MGWFTAVKALHFQQLGFWLSATTLADSDTTAKSSDELYN